jgi:PAS domain S-box-containing protein
MTQHFKHTGIRVWRLTIPLVLVGTLIGELAIAGELVDSRLDESVMHQIAVFMVVLISLGVRVIGINAEALQKAEHVIRRNEERYRALVHNSSDIVAIVDETGTFTYVSPAVEQLDAEPDDYVGISMHTHLHSDDCEILRTTFASALAAADELIGDRARRCEVRFQHPDETWHWYDVVFLDLRHVAAVAGIVMNARDVTERRSLETQLGHSQKLESVGRLAAGIAHEINTPVQFIGDNLRFLDEAFKVLSEMVSTESSVDTAHKDDADYYLSETPQAIRQSQDGVSRVATIVKAMKAFAHPGHASAQADLNEAIRNTLTIARSEIADVADVELDLGEIPTVSCVLSDINQVLLNLIVNAVQAIVDSGKFAESRGTVRVVTREDGSDVVIGVKDNGMGIPADARHHIFEQFFTTKEVGRGTGQGLSLAHSVIDNHGGKITFETESGVGTTFWIRLPIER